jgi:hypothetical protein
VFQINFHQAKGRNKPYKSQSIKYCINFKTKLTLIHK